MNRTVSTVPSERNSPAPGFPAASARHELSLTEELLWAKADFRRRLLRLEFALTRARNALEAAAIRRRLRRLEVDTQLDYLRIQAQHARALSLDDLADSAEAAIGIARGVYAAA